MLEEPSTRRFWGEMEVILQRKISGFIDVNANSYSFAQTELMPNASVTKPAPLKDYCKVDTAEAHSNMPMIRIKDPLGRGG